MQALAAIGQGRLIALWDNLFSQLEQPIAQVLLTRGDISDVSRYVCQPVNNLIHVQQKTRYLNAANTFKELLDMGVVPIVNENDTISVSVSRLPPIFRLIRRILPESHQEIKFGDNDTLSAITSSMIHADYLFLLTDVDGLYTTNPRKDPNAKQIEVVNSISKIREEGEINQFLFFSYLHVHGSEHDDSGIKSGNRRYGDQTYSSRDIHSCRRHDNHHIEQTSRKYFRHH
jgi:glutamate 5-kinase